MKVIEGFNIEDKECWLELLQDVVPGLENIGAELKKAISIANMQGKRRIRNRRSSLHEMTASAKKESELLGEEASIEVAAKIKTINDLEPKVKNMENRLAMMEAVKEPVVTAVATLEKAVDASGMGAQS